MTLQQQITDHRWKEPKSSFKEEFAERWHYKWSSQSIPIVSLQGKIPLEITVFPTNMTMFQTLLVQRKTQLPTQIFLLPHLLRDFDALRGCKVGSGRLSTWMCVLVGLYVCVCDGGGAASLWETGRWGWKWVGRGLMLISSYSWSTHRIHTHTHTHDTANNTWIRSSPNEAKDALLGSRACSSSTVCWTQNGFNAIQNKATFNYLSIYLLTLS